MTLFTELTAYVTAVHTSWDGEDEEICLRADALDGSYVYLNVIAHKPRLGTDYTHYENGYVQNLKIRFTVLNEYTPSDL